MVTTTRLSSIVLIWCLLPHTLHSFELLRGASGANIGANLGVSLENSCKTLSQGFQKGTRLGFDDQTRKTMDSLANPKVDISPSTFNSSSRLIKQAGFTAGGIGLMLGSVAAFATWATRYFEKATPTNYGDYGLAACSFATFLAGATLIYKSDKLARGKSKILKDAETQTGAIFQARLIERRHSIN